MATTLPQAKNPYQINQNPYPELQPSNSRAVQPQFANQNNMGPNFNQNGQRNPQINYNNQPPQPYNANTYEYSVPYSPNQYTPNQYNPNQHNAPIPYQPSTNIIIDRQSSGTLAASGRNAFIKKVYCLLTLQLLVTALIIGIGYYDNNYRRVITSVPFAVCTLVLLIVFMIGAAIVMSCNQYAFKNCQGVIFMAFTVIFAFFLASGVLMFNATIVVYAGALTITALVVCTIYVLICGGMGNSCLLYILVMLVISVEISIIAVIFRSNAGLIAYSILMAMIMSIYIIYDIELIVGNYGIKFGLDDYYIATLILYVDLMRMFLYILQALGNK